MKKVFDDVRLIHRYTKCREKLWAHLTKTCDYATRKKRWLNGLFDNEDEYGQVKLTRVPSCSTTFSQTDSQLLVHR